MLGVQFISILADPHPVLLWWWGWGGLGGGDFYYFGTTDLRVFIPFTIKSAQNKNKEMQVAHSYINVALNSFDKRLFQGVWF